MFRAGIIGCGNIGCGYTKDFIDIKWRYANTHAGAYKDNDGVQLVAVADVDKKRLAHCSSVFDIKKCYIDYNDMLKNESLDIVSICTHNNLHAEIISEVLKNKSIKVIFCEKPFTQSLAHADQAIELCAQKGVLLAVDHLRRFDPTQKIIKEYIHHRLGALQHVVCYYGAGIANGGTHLFDLLNFYFGRPKSVRAEFSRILSKRPMDLNFDVYLELENEVRVCALACDYNAYALFEINILGTNGRISVSSYGFRTELKVEYSGPSDLVKQGQKLYSASSFIDGKPRRLIYLGIEHLLDCMKNNKVPMSTGEDGRNALEVISASYESAENSNKTIDFPLIFRNRIVYSA